MSAANKAALVTAPVEGQNTYMLPGDDWATASYIEVPASWATATVRFEADGADWHILFSATNTTTLSETAESTVTSNAIATVGSASMKIKDGTFVDVDLEMVGKAEKRYLLIKCPSGTSAQYLRIMRSSGPVGTP